jgi:hypothetical protein
MNTKLLSKEVIRGLLKHEYNNDPRITDKVLFDGKQLTLQGYILLKSILPTADYRSCCLDEVAHHCYVSFEFDSDNNNWNYDDSRERAIVREKMKPIINRLESIVGDDECYFVSDVITGELVFTALALSPIVMVPVDKLYMPYVLPVTVPPVTATVPVV